MRRDRFGEPVDDDVEDLAPDVDRLRHDLICSDGWVGADEDERPRPCPVCRPHIARFRDRLDLTIYGRRRRRSLVA